METMFFIWFGVCFVCYMIRTVFNVLNYKKKPISREQKNFDLNIHCHGYFVVFMVPNVFFRSD